MEILAIIPARGGSKGIPGKNIKDLAGKPLVAHSILAAKKSNYITRTIVSTEDNIIKDVAIKFGAETIKRPEELAVDTAMTAPVLTHVIKHLKETENYYPDIVVLLQATCPLRTSQDIDDGIEFFLKNKENCDSVFAAYNIGLTHAYWKEEHNGTFKALYDYHSRPRRQDTDRHYNLWRESGSLYIIKTDVLMKLEDFVGDTPKIFPIEQIIDIDTIEDFDICEKILVDREKND